MAKGAVATVAPPVEFDWATTDAEVERLARTDPHAALALAERWLAHECAAGSAEGQARALRSRAQALRFLGTFDAAIATYAEAEERFRALGLEYEAARTQISHVGGLRMRGRYAEAVDLGLRTRDYFRERRDELQAAKVSLTLGTVYRPMGRLADALASYREARTVFRRLGESLLLADAEQNIGNVLIDLGRYEEALRHLRAAERIRRRLGLRSEVARALLNIGTLAHRRGDYGHALRALTEAGQIFEALGVEHEARVVDARILPICAALNLHEESRRAAERAIGGLRSVDMPWELGQALLAAGALAEQDGELDHAAARIDEARVIFDQLGNQLWQAFARLHRARLVLPRAARDKQDIANGNGGRATDATDVASEPGDRIESFRAALDECRQATHALEAAGALDNAAFGRLVEAALLAQLADAKVADLAEALDRYHDVLRVAVGLNADHLLYQAHASVGELLQDADPDAAADNYRRAVHHLEAVRARALADDLKLSFLADKADLYERIVGLLIERNSADALAEAYSYVERSKSRTLLEHLLGGTTPARGGRQSKVARLAQRVRDLRARLNQAYVLAYGSDAVPSADSVSRSGHAEAVAQLEQEFAHATRELQLAARTEPMVVGAHPSPGGRVRVPNGVALIEFYAVGDQLFAFVDRDDGLHLHRMGTLDRVAQLVDRLNFQLGKMALGTEYVRANLEKLRAGVERPLQQLYRATIEPLEADLRECSRLVIVPHGPLHGLPFHAFHDGTTYLAERFTVTYAPSAGVYQACAATARPIGDRALIVGIEDPGLPWVAREVEAVAAAWPEATVLRGAKATAAALRRRVGRFDALHVATHGVYRADNPAFSSIKLSDAWLTVNDLAELAHGAQLVTLSACETGVNGLTVGDEVVGLTRGILTAGCSTVVASLWTVSDESTARLMDRFYAHLRGAPEPAAALQAAMLELRSEYDHPYYWAAFATVGGGLGRPRTAETTGTSSEAATRQRALAS